MRKYIVPGRAGGRIEGVVQGEAKTLLTVLETRGSDITDADRTRIAGCRDPEQLDIRLRRATTVDSVDELFG
ncbi:MULTISPECIES: hypothetical protein [unclassified Pseudonocardia]|uniref:hypothetical protein n=1 Tax=unclassified Pseudonocardia TaxID=2619320 RepID=UPI001AC39966|nr:MULTISPECIES: hypothetical protein [unclassified Pseudonocardia]MBN9099990.1 hypothetical protein [Pseudonocardia sp.]